MINQQLYSIYDNKAGYHVDFFVMPTDVDAERRFCNMLGNDKLNLGRYPGDYHLCCLGFIDVVSAEIKTVLPFKILGSGFDYVRKMAVMNNAMKQVMDSIEKAPQDGN